MPPKWKKIAGSLPKGLKLHSTGVLSGTPSIRALAGTYTFTVRLQNHGKPVFSVTKVFSLTLH